MGRSVARIPRQNLLVFCSGPRRAKVFSLSEPEAGAWLTDHRAVGYSASRIDAPAYRSGVAALLTRSDFESAVKDALRHYTQPDLLAENALSRTRLLTSSEPGAATPQALRALLAETAKTLFAGERDQRLYKVLDLTYLHPAPKQEAVADRLGLSFSTYRRHLTTAVDRLTEWLWRQEQGTPQIESIARHSTERAFMDALIHQSDNITAPTDVFRPAAGGDT